MYLHSSPTGAGPGRGIDELIGWTEDQGPKALDSAPIEEPVSCAVTALAAAEQMLAYKIGGQPVVGGERLVGVITEPTCCACGSPTRYDSRNWW